METRPGIANETAPAPGLRHSAMSLDTNAAMQVDTEPVKLGISSDPPVQPQLQQPGSASRKRMLCDLYGNELQQEPVPWQAMHGQVAAGDLVVGPGNLLATTSTASMLTQGQAAPMQWQTNGGVRGTSLQVAEAAVRHQRSVSDSMVCTQGQSMQNQYTQEDISTKEVQAMQQHKDLPLQLCNNTEHSQMALLTNTTIKEGQSASIDQNAHMPQSNLVPSIMLADTEGAMQSTANRSGYNNQKPVHEAPNQQMKAEIPSVPNLKHSNATAQPMDMQGAHLTTPMQMRAMHQLHPAGPVPDLETAAVTQRQYANHLMVDARQTQQGQLVGSPGIPSRPATTNLPVPSWRGANPSMSSPPPGPPVLRGIPLSDQAVADIQARLMQAGSNPASRPPGYESSLEVSSLAWHWHEGSNDNDLALRGMHQDVETPCSALMGMFSTDDRPPTALPGMPLPPPAAGQLENNGVNNSSPSPGQLVTALQKPCRPPSPVSSYRAALTKHMSRQDSHASASRIPVGDTSKHVPALPIPQLPLGRSTSDMTFLRVGSQHVMRNGSAENGVLQTTDPLVSPWSLNERRGGSGNFASSASVWQRETLNSNGPKPGLMHIPSAADRQMHGHATVPDLSGRPYTDTVALKQQQQQQQQSNHNPAMPRYQSDAAHMYGTLVGRPITQSQQQQQQPQTPVLDLNSPARQASMSQAHAEYATNGVQPRPGPAAPLPPMHSQPRHQQLSWSQGDNLYAHNPPAGAVHGGITDQHRLPSYRNLPSGLYSPRPNSPTLITDRMGSMDWEQADRANVLNNGRAINGSLAMLGDNNNNYLGAQDWRLSRNNSMPKARFNESDSVMFSPNPMSATHHAMLSGCNMPSSMAGGMGQGRHEQLGRQANTYVRMNDTSPNSNNTRMAVRNARLSSAISLPATPSVFQQELQRWHTAHPATLQLNINELADQAEAQMTGQLLASGFDLPPIPELSTGLENNQNLGLNSILNSINEDVDLQNGNDAQLLSRHKEQDQPWIQMEPFADSKAASNKPKLNHSSSTTELAACLMNSAPSVLYDKNGSKEEESNAVQAAAMAVAAAATAETVNTTSLSALLEGLPSQTLASLKDSESSPANRNSPKQAPKTRITRQGSTCNQGQQDKADIDGSKGADNKKSRENLPKDSVSLMKQWLYEHISHPYPTEAEKAHMMERTGLDLMQLNNWFINARVRIWRPIIITAFGKHMDRLLSLAQASGDELQEARIQDAATNPNTQLGIILEDQEASLTLVAEAQRAACELAEKDAARGSAIKKRLPARNGKS